MLLKSLLQELQEAAIQKLSPAVVLKDVVKFVTGGDASDDPEWAADIKNAAQKFSKDPSSLTSSEKKTLDDAFARTAQNYKEEGENAMLKVLTQLRQSLKRSKVAKSTKPKPNDFQSDVIGEVVKDISSNITGSGKAKWIADVKQAYNKLVKTPGSLTDQDKEALKDLFVKAKGMYKDRLDVMNDLKDHLR